MSAEEPILELQGLPSTAVFKRCCHEILFLLQNRVGIDFSQHRRTVFLKKVQRRMFALVLENLEDYNAYLQKDPQEVHRLARELLQRRMHLLQDTEVYQALLHILPGLLATTPRPQMWVPACSTGEEAFTLAMVVAQCMAAQEATDEYMIFGTDIDAPALALARRSQFDADMAAELPSELIQRYLWAGESHYQVNPALAHRCVFLTHDMMTTPPFADLSLIDCRNWLPQLEPLAQRQLLESFAQVLRPGGLLLVGQDESLLGHQDLFKKLGSVRGLFVRPDPQQRYAETAENLDSSELLSPENYKSIFMTSRAPLLVCNAALEVLAANEEAAKLRSRHPQDLVGQSVFDWLSPEEATTVREQMNGAVSGALLAMVVHLLPDYRMVRLRFSIRPDQRSPMVLVEMVSIGTMAPLDPFTHDWLLHSREAVVRISPRGIIDIFNPRAEALTGWTVQEARGLPYERVINLLQNNQPVSDLLQNLPRHFKGQDTQCLARNNRRVSVEVRSFASQDGTVLLLEDVGQVLLLQDELNYRISHDPITGLLNREEFETRLRAAFLQSQQNAEHQHVLCYLDVDQFKVVNDTVGHEAGDELLHELAGELRVRLPEQDAFARLGGDEFGILMLNCDREQAEKRVEALIDAAQHYRFHWNDQLHAVSISVGMTLIDHRVPNITRALSLADSACFEAKEAGRNRFHYIDLQEAISHQHRDMSFVSKVGEALDDHRLMLFSEDVVSLKNPKQVVYRELLLRVRDKEGRPSSPGPYIRAAERYYLMGSIDRWVVRQALHTIKSSAQLSEDDNIIYAINLSGQSISDPKFLQYVIKELENHQLKPQKLCFEITETAAIHHMQQAERFTRALSDLGCLFAVDDFGVGMASFNYLRNFPLNFLKIDGSFVRAILESKIDHGFVDNMNRIGQQMGLITIAEHVEATALLAPLSDIGVDWVQGHGIHEARPFF